MFGGAEADADADGKDQREDSRRHMMNVCVNASGKLTCSVLLK